MHLRPPIVAILFASLLLSSPGISSVRAEPELVGSAAPLPPVTEADGRFGIVQAIQSPDQALAAGARWDRVVFPWSLIQRDGPDSWQELYYSDDTIRAQARRGVTMVGVMIYTPQWASVDPPRGRPSDRPQGLELRYNDPRNYWGQFVRKLVARHRGVIDHWAVWNEPDFQTFDGSYEEYFKLLKVAYLNIKEVNPNAKVILGGLAYWWDKENNRRPYLGPLLEVIGRDPERKQNNYYFDIANVHVYAAPLNSYAQPLIMREILNQHGLQKPIWISESNVAPVNDPTNPLPPGGLRATLDEQASYVVQSAALALAAGVERYAIYKMVDEAPENGTELWGLVRNDRSARPAYVAYQVATRYFSNVRSAVYSWPGSAEVPKAEQVEPILRSNSGRPQFIWPAQVSQVVMERGPNRTTVVWNNSPAEVVHRVPANARQATLVTKNGNTTTIDARDGVYTLELAASTHNVDKRDWSIYMIGGEPYIIDEHVVPLPTERVVSRIQSVWPHGGAPDAAKANLTAQLLLPDTAAEPVPCRYSPETVQLWAKRNNRREELVANGVRRMADEDGLRYPVWDFNDVDVAFARAMRAEAPREETSSPTEPGSAAPVSFQPSKNSIEFSVVVDGIETDAFTWTYGGPNATDWTRPPIRPSKSCE